MPIVCVGIDLAKNVFAMHGVDDGGRAALVRPSVRRDQLMKVVSKLPACIIGMETCSGAHHWARQFVKFSHIVKLMAPKPILTKGEEFTDKGQAYYKERYRERVLWNLTRRAEKMGMRLISSEATI